MVQRYSNRPIHCAKLLLSLLFNAMAKIPMQAFILFIGTMVFAVHLFVPPPAIFQPVEAKHAAQSDRQGSTRRRAISQHLPSAAMRVMRS